MDKTANDLSARLSYLKGLNSRNELTLSLAGELDACNQGLDAWKEYLSRRAKRKARKNRR